MFNIRKSIIAIVAVVGTALGTWIVGRYIEKPIQRWLHNKFVK